MSLRKLFAILFCVTFILSLTALSVSADGGRVIDQEGLFTDSELAEINSAIEKAEKSSDGVRFYVVTEKNLYPNKERLMSVCGALRGDDVCILAIKTDGGDTERYYDFYTNGLATKRISDSEIDDILDDRTVYQSLKYSDASEGVLRFLELTPKAIAVPYLTIVIIAIFAGLTAAGITLGVVISQYKKKMRATNYPLDKYASLQLTEQEDHFIGKHVAVVVTSSAGPGGGRSGGGGSGGARGSR